MNAVLSILRCARKQSKGIAAAFARDLLSFSLVRLPNRHQNPFQILIVASFIFLRSAAG